MLKHHFYTDGGHGWLKVPLSRLKKMSIADKITSYSYMLTSNAYLEEDCDVSTYVRALQVEAGLNPDAMDSDANREWLQSFWDNTTTHDSSMSRAGSRIRSYPNYEYITDEQQGVLEQIREAVLNHLNWGRKTISTIKKAGKGDLLHWNKYYKLGFEMPNTVIDQK
jgi:hypothetical protein